VPSIPEVQRWLVRQIAEEVGASPESIRVDEPLGSIGLSSTQAVTLSGDLSEWLGRRLPPTLAYDYPTIAALSAHLGAGDGEAAPPEACGSTEPSRGERTDPDDCIAIIGMGCRFPGGVSDPDSLWRLLDEGIDAISEVPPERWDIDSLYDPSPDAVGKMCTRQGGFLADIDKFDPAFFGVTPREAAKMDPQHRLLLETTWEALEHAGIPSEDLVGSETGVFIGTIYQEYGHLVNDLARLDGYVAIGSAGSAASGRISYHFGLKGPCMSIDTACSSSLVAVHLACQALRSGECSLALAGGVTLMLTPTIFVEFSRLRGLAGDGRCKTFAASADGVSWGEGCGVLVLKRLIDAERDGDSILAIIRGSAVNQDGRTNGLTAPNGPSQQAVIRQALRRARVSASSLSYVECHGTGTRLGDPIEVQALGAELAESSAPAEPVVIGSIKTNIGHSQAAAGVAGLMKVVLSLQHERIPKNLHFDAPSPIIPWQDLSLKVATEPLAWPRGERVRRAGVSSFGLSGTNAHVILEEAGEAAPVRASPERALELIVLSGKSAAALRAHASRLSKHLQDHPESRIGDIAWSLATARDAMDHRLAVPGASREELGAALDAAAQGRTLPGSVRGVASPAPGRLAFLFSGQGTQVLGMGAKLYEAWPVFRQALDECAGRFDRELERPLRQVMWAAPGTSEAGWLDQTEYTQPALFTLGYALCALWRSWGVEPSLVAGHSIGELVAAHVAGLFSLDDAVKMVAARGRLMQALPTVGAMVALEASEVEVEAEIVSSPEGVSIAAVNGPYQTVISGDQDAVDAIALKFSGRGVQTKRLEVSRAFHSAHMDRVLGEFERVASSVTYQRPSLELVSNVTGRLVTQEIMSPSYWARQVRDTVRFGDGVRALYEAGARTFVELGPRSALLGVVPQNLPDEARATLIPSIRAKGDERRSVLGALADYWVGGRRVNWSGVFPPGARRVGLPTYPWQRERYWIDTENAPRRKREADPFADWVYQVEWQERARSSGAPASGVSGSWLVLRDRAGVGDALMTALEARGCACVVVDEPPVTRDAATEVSRALATRSDWQGILHAWGVDDEAKEEASARAVGEATSRCTEALLGVTQALLGLERRPRLWVVTRGACAVDRGSIVKPWQSALWGLGRAAAAELGKAWGGLLDLDPAGVPGEHEAVVTELLSPDGEQQLAFRDGRRCVARLAIADLAPKGALLPSAEGTYLITGGLGALGLSVARRMVENGARHLLLIGRRGVETPGASRVIAHLQAQEARVTVAAADVTDAEQMGALLNGLTPPLRGVVHAAGVVDDGLLVNLDATRMRRVLAPKVEGAWTLHLLTRRSTLDFFVLFSSIAAVVGPMGQGSYAAANAFLDGLSEMRRRQGLTALSIAWGVWEEGMGSAEQRQFLDASGLTAIPAALALDAMERLGSTAAMRVVAHVNWERLERGSLLAGKGQFFEAVGSLRGHAGPHHAPHQLFRAEDGQPRDPIERAIRQLWAEVLQSEDVGVHDDFFKVGGASLTAGMLASRLRALFKVDLAPNSVFQHPTVAQLAQHVEAIEVQPGLTRKIASLLLEIESHGHL
jgi:epothilone polyketide synthase D